MAEKNAPAMVFNVDLHCEGCAQKVRKCLKNFTGVKSVKTDLNGNRVTVAGNVEAEFVKRILEEKTKKKVEFQSPKPDAGAGKKSGGESEKKKDEGKKPKEAPATVTVVLKTDVHCDGCATKMTKIVRKYKGVKSANVDLSKDQIVVTGTMDMKQMLPYLNTKFKKTVELVPAPAPEKKADNKVKDENPKPVEKVESVNRMEYHGYPYSYGGVFYNHQAPPPGNGYGMEYGNVPPAYLQAPQMFSDENPNACSVM